MAIFKRKITLWLNDTQLSMGDVLDAAWELCEGDGNDMIVGEERGHFEQFCSCGDWDCPNKKPAEVN